MIKFAVRAVVIVAEAFSDRTSAIFRKRGASVFAGGFFRTASATSSIKGDNYPGIMFWDMSHDKTDASNSLLYKIAATAGYNP